ncbi:MAG: glycosyltransferase family 2 protein [Alphaproteobacteria bacterium]|nr:glycosyltransferase family 2 protein [Alphaproteobacteria bacterium]
MYKSRRVLLIAPAFNEEAKIGEVVRRTPRDIVDTILVVDDCSTDRTAEVARARGADVLINDRRRGVGYAIRRGYTFARTNGFDIVVVIAGNNKDSPEEIIRLLDPICDGKCDFVMGSRYLPGGVAGGDMPVYRKLATRLHPLLVRLLTGRRVTESTNGYRALKVSVLNDPRIDLYQIWLDSYELEMYIFMKLIKLGYRMGEVPVSKIYPPRHIGNTKMVPVLDWWKMLAPIFIFGFGFGDGGPRHERH